MNDQHDNQLGDDEDEGPLSWDEHADDLQGSQLALAMCRSYLSQDDQDLEVVIAQMRELFDPTEDDPDRQRLGQVEASLVSLVLEFGTSTHGRYLDAVLRQKQDELAKHIAEYDPDEPAA